MFVVGLMSGTSLDGIDASLVEIKGYGKQTKIKVMKSITIPYEKNLKEELLCAMDVEKSNVEQICSLHVKLSYYFADAVKKVCSEAKFSMDELDLIGSHGQTLYHIPYSDETKVRSTLQIGNASVLAYETNTMVVADFRSMDIAASGEGAPLIPYVDWLLFRNQSTGRILQNIGGIGNCTILPENANLENVYAFDTGPGNMIIDEVCKMLLQIPYDDNGEIAEKGIVHQALVSEWMHHDFFLKQPPKSTGRELFGRAFTKKVIADCGHLPVEDTVATATYFTAYSIVEAYKKYVFPHVDIKEIIISGGGGRNKTLCQMIQRLLPQQQVFVMDQLGITTDEKEAVGFALLANEMIHQQEANVPNATGAKQPVILGQLTLPPMGDHKHILKKVGLM